MNIFIHMFEVINLVKKWTIIFSSISRFLTVIQFQE